jgi:hypothetical protein
MGRLMFRAERLDRRGIGSVRRSAHFAPWRRLRARRARADVLCRPDPPRGIGGYGPDHRAAATVPKASSR